MSMGSNTQSAFSANDNSNIGSNSRSQFNIPMGGGGGGNTKRFVFTAARKQTSPTTGAAPSKHSSSHKSQGGKSSSGGAVRPFGELFGILSRSKSRKRT